MTDKGEMSESTEMTGSTDPVGEALRGLSAVLSVTPEHGWSRGIQAAVLEALEDAVRPHQPHPDTLRPDRLICLLDERPWPCPTYRQVQDTLEGLL
jgi:hypothetical protein